MGTHSGTLDDSGTGTGLRHLWLTSAQACQHFGIGPRALRKRVATGTVDRHKVGRKSLYRIAAPVPPSPPTEEPGTTIAEKAAPVRHLYRNRGTDSGTNAAPAQAPQSENAPDLASLAGLVQLLANDLADASQGKGEAVAIGWMLAEQRDNLAAELAALHQALSDVAASPLAMPVRRRILRALGQAIH